MYAFPAYTLEKIADLTLIQFHALQLVGAEIAEQKAKSLSI